MANSETLRDLIRINNDRVTGYSKAATQTDDQDLQTLFSQLAQQSRQFASELRSLVSDDKNVTDETTAAGKIYRTWMDVKATFGGDDRKGILASCEFGEDAAQKAYKEALEDDDLTPDCRVTIERQKATLRQAHDKIKMMRDTAAAHH
ncbi:MAG TPA: PA2169 family four-helix-bundle protein [Chitinophagaceae bacterium]|nr:PA2169 family four-helix-bundle protein [Chitinophagaceae bacterium]